MKKNIERILHLEIDVLPQLIENLLDPDLFVSASIPYHESLLWST